VTDSSPPPVLEIPAWQQIPDLAHGFYLRRGGVSVGPYAELNLSFKVGDRDAAVRSNWNRVRARAGDRLEMVTMDQVHGDTVAEVGTAADSPGEADAMISTARGVGLCVLTADCVPVLLVAPKARAVAAVHAGWRGTSGGVVVSAVARMVGEMNVRPHDILAAIGPAIGACCYEVDAVIADDIESRWGSMPNAIRRYPRDAARKARIDLRAINANLLLAAGLEPGAVSRTGGCTSCDSDQFFSHRAACRGGAPKPTGRQLSFIGWEL
jgi:YfiH family protein